MEEYKICIESYEISNFGNLRRKLKTGEYKYIKGSINNHGYKILHTKRDNKAINYTFHSLVAKVFISERPIGLVVDHIDRNRLNNNINNLRYITQKENTHNSDRYKSHILEQGKERKSIVEKEYVTNNKEIVREYQKDYHKEYRKEILQCECGSKYNKNNKSQHLKTIKHLSYIN